MDETTQVQPSGSNKTWLWVGLGVLLLIIIGGAVMGFGRGTNLGSAYFAPGGDVDRNIDGSTTYTSDEGSVTVGGGSMPSNWPSDAPEAYSGATIIYSGTTNPQTGEAGSAVSYTTSASAASVVEYYESSLRSQGWTVTATAEVAGTRIISAQKDTRVIGIYVATDGQGQTSVTAGVQL